MKNVVVPEVATKEMLEIMDNFDFEEVPTKVLWDVLMDNAPDTGMIAVDKVKFEYSLGQIESALDFASDAITWETTQKWVNKVKVRLQALKNMEG